MVNIREWITVRICKICDQLEHGIFLNRELRARLKAELSTLLKQRDRYDEFQQEMAQEKWAGLKDPTWGGQYTTPMVESPGIESDTKERGSRLQETKSEGTQGSQDMQGLCVSPDYEESSE